jgi:hypothetical protein
VQEEIDAKEASTLARRHFEDVHGTYAMFAFRIHSASKIEGAWRVVCSFSPTGRTERLQYAVEVDARTKRTEKIEQMAEQR